METTKLLNSDFIDILFDDRNKDYGAYELRRKYNKRVRNAVMGMSAIVVVVIGGYLISSNLIASDKTHEALTIYDEPEMIEAKIKEEPPVYTPPPVRQEPPPAAKATVDAAIFRIAPDEDVKPEDEVPKNEDLIDKVIGVANAAGDPDGVDFEVPDGVKGGTGVIEAPKAKEKEEIFMIVEMMPEFPGGEAALMKFLRNNMHYPSVASDNGISGTVFVKFVVDKNGEINNVTIEGAKKGGGLEEEAMRVVKKMPKWKPGKQNGETVAVYFNLPIRFTLADQ
ncbi:energy transducer TonB [Chitinophaga niabensis]|uniref:energy transducer TonB n=1 Tax=Chitinophaga niabensis TaxID=536979 RepID=UPI0031BBBAA7